MQQQTLLASGNIPFCCVQVFQEIDQTDSFSDPPTAAKKKKKKNYLEGQFLCVYLM